MGVNQEATIFLSQLKRVDQCDGLIKMQGFAIDAGGTSLQEFNDCVLEPNAYFCNPFDGEYDRAFMPLIGGLEMSGPDGKTLEINPGKIFAGSVRAPISKIHNPQGERVNFLEFVFTPGTGWIRDGCELEFEMEINKLVPLAITGEKCKAWLGQYKGREQDYLFVDGCHKRILVYVIDGVFEVQDRLLHARDGLELCGFTTIEFEALSENSIILFQGV
ncbi:hypothetical protein [Membranihabitans maritimus]|uniref:hypothetical protein n=1 Tax=Membranihabitans maritimus TaxID=2904244 RepID=UPI001F3975D5|nr:hypothetical protein [Membranihabitans maritimus]